MRLTRPRIMPVEMDHLDAATEAVLAPLREHSGGKVGGGRVLNIFRTMARTPDAARAFLVWGGHILSRRNSLSERDRELVILRTGYNCRSGYEWAQHRRIGLACGLNETDIAAIKVGPTDAHWSAHDRALLQATDDLVADHHVSDASWAALHHLGDGGRMDLVYTVAQYTQVSMLLNSFGVQLEDGAAADPDLCH